MAGNFNGEDKLTADIRVYADPRLKELASDVARKEGIPLSELVVRALAAFIGHPELAAIPRKAWGRPLGSKNKNGNGKGRKTG